MTDRPVGPPVENWHVPPRPGPDRLTGRYASLARLSLADHAEPLFKAFQGHDWIWDYMPVGPFASAGDVADWITRTASGDDPCLYAITDDDSGTVCGFAAFLRVMPQAGAIEVGYVAMAPTLQRSRAATESIFLMMQWAFEAGYRRFEWKCDALNAPSRRAARRFGFSFEGVFRQAAVVKGRNRDTAWFSVIDRDWPALRGAFVHWLAPGNFDDRGEQKQRLSDLTAPIAAAGEAEAARL